jgi:hypothetical protein
VRRASSLDLSFARPAKPVAFEELDKRSEALSADHGMEDIFRKCADMVQCFVAFRCTTINDGGPQAADLNLELTYLRLWECLPNASRCHRVKL